MSAAVTVLTIVGRERANKLVTRAEDGTILKEGAVDGGCYVAQERVAPDADALAAILAEVGDDPRKVLMPGTFLGAGPDPFHVVPRAMICSRLGLDPERVAGWHEIDGRRVIARLKANTRHGGWFLLDRDLVDGMPDWLAALDREAWLAAMAEIIPGLETAALIWMPSTSGRVLVDGSPWSTKASWHVYALADDPEQLARVWPSLLVRAFGLGYGFFREKHSRDSGEVVARVPWSIIDPSTCSPERLAFVGKPTVMGEGLSVSPPDVCIIQQSGCVPFAGIADLPEKEKRRAAEAGIKIGRDKGAKVEHVVSATLALDLEIETEAGFRTIRDLWLDGAKHTRCQSPVRDSSSWAAYVGTHENGEPFLFDSGAGTKYVLPPAEAGPKPPNFLAHLTAWLFDIGGKVQGWEQIAQCDRFTRNIFRAAVRHGWQGSAIEALTEQLAGLLVGPMGLAKSELLTKLREEAEAAMATAFACHPERVGWPVPDLTVISPRRLEAPALPLEVFGSSWSQWISHQAEVKGSPPDYVAAGLLSSASVLVGNARWGSPWSGWAEPPVIWAAVVGNPSSNKSPGLDATISDVLRVLEQEANADLDARLYDWRTRKLIAEVARKQWQEVCGKDLKASRQPLPLPPEAEDPAEPQARRLLTNDPTSEKMGRLVLANPKGLLLFRDELAGWLGSLDKYGGKGGDRGFYLEAYGGRSFSIDRIRDSQPVIVPALLVGIIGGIQPDRLCSSILSQDDDGLAARFIFVWPERIPPIRPTRVANDGAKKRLVRLHELTLTSAGEHENVPFEHSAADALQAFRLQVAEAEAGVSGFFLSWLGKLPGFAVRIATVLEHLYWCGEEPVGSKPPGEISARATTAAITFLDRYALPMARRCFGEAALPKPEKDAATIARWIAKQTPIPEKVNARDLQRLRLTGLNTRDDVHEALSELEQAGWVRAIQPQVGWQRKGRSDWDVSPRLTEALS